MGRLDKLIARLGGPPIVGYHGTRSADDFAAFDPARIGTGAGDSQGFGYYITESQPFAWQYGRPIQVEVAVPRSRMAEMYDPLRDQPEMLDRFYDAIQAAPHNKWRDDAFTNALHRDGQAQLAYQSLLRAHNVGDGGERLGRLEAGRRASQALFDRGVYGGSWWNGDVRNHVLFPGVEGQIRILSQGR